MPTKIKETQKFLNAITAINAGGCGLAALALYDTAKREGKKPKIVYLYHVIFESDSKRINDEYKEGKRKTAYSCSHVMIKIGNRLWDAEGPIKESSRLCWYVMDDTITREHLVASINNKGSWNEQFNRKAWLPKIKKFIKRGTQIKA